MLAEFAQTFKGRTRDTDFAAQALEHLRADLLVDRVVFHHQDVLAQMGQVGAAVDSELGGDAQNRLAQFGLAQRLGHEALEADLVGALDVVR